MRSVRAEQGQVVVVTAVLMLVLLGVLGLVLDIGAWYSDSSKLQQGADAAAISGAQYYLGGSTAPATSPCAGQVSAVTCAAHVASLNDTELSGAPQLVTVDGLVGVEVDANDSHPPNFFAHLFGIHPAVTSTAVASAVPPGAAADIVPIAVNVEAADLWQSGDLLTLTFDRVTGGNGFVLARNWGCQGTDKVSSCMTDGCGCTASVGETLVENPENTWHNHQVQAAWGSLAGQTVYAAVYDSSLTIVGFASFVVGSAHDDSTITLTFTGQIVSSLPSSNPGQFFGTAAIALTR